MEYIKEYSLDKLYQKIFGKNVHFISDCEFFPNFNVVIKINDISINHNEILIKGYTKNKKNLTIGSNMKNLQFEVL